MSEQTFVHPDAIYQEEMNRKDPWYPGNQPIPPHIGEIPPQLEMLEKYSENLLMLTRELSDLLAPIKKPQPKTAASGPTLQNIPVNPGMSIMANRIHTVNERILGISALITQLKAELDL